MRTRNQRLAEQIFAQVQPFANNDALRVRYGALCHQFPYFVLENGLAQAIGFLAGKGATAGSAEAHFLAHLAEILELERDRPERTVFEADLDQYQLLTRRALEAGAWYKRFAQGVLKVTADADRGDD